MSQQIFPKSTAAASSVSGQSGLPCGLVVRQEDKKKNFFFKCAKKIDGSVCRLFGDWQKNALQAHTEERGWKKCVRGWP
jgi:hypothetical protein